MRVNNIRKMMECLRGAFARLRPPDLGEVGLSASLRTMLAGWEAQRGARLTRDCDLDESTMDDAIAPDLYRIVQECVTNAMRHGAPAWVRVTLRHVAETITLTVEDDGGGTLSADTPGHGILGINERASAMGGQLRMQETDEGARIVVFTMHQGPAFALKSIEAGAAGYVTKSSAPENLIKANFGVLAGRTAFRRT